MSSNSWNYRIIDHGDWLGLHEVYYRDGKPHSYTAEPASFACGPEEGRDGIARSLEKALRDARERDILPVSAFPPNVAPIP